jgi:hypothetical protein
MRTSRYRYSTENPEAITSPPFESSRPGSSGVSYDANSSPVMPPSVNPHQVVARGFAQTFGIHFPFALLMVGCDLMLHSADVVSAGLLIPFSAAAGVVLGVIVYRGQRRFYGDDDEVAKIKGTLCFLLTAIPSPLPYGLFLGAGLLGLFRKRS